MLEIRKRSTYLLNFCHGSGELKKPMRGIKENGITKMC
jgi:hypothetical protein